VENLAPIGEYSITLHFQMFTSTILSSVCLKIKSKTAVNRKEWECFIGGLKYLSYNKNLNFTAIVTLISRATLKEKPLRKR
jgi:hypothetical protein